MQIKKFDNRDDWEEARRGKVTGSKVKDVIVKRGTQPKMGFYEIIAERLAVPSDGENPMNRGNRLEEEAIAQFTKETGIEINTDLVIWVRDDNEYIAISPDGYAPDLTIAVEAKCLNSATHIKAFLTQKPPSEYEDQGVQYFVTNNDLQTLYFAFYDPRLSVKSFFFLTITRFDYADKIEKYLAEEKRMLVEIDEIVSQLTQI